MDKNKIREALEVGLNYVLNAGYSRHKDDEEKEIREALAELDTDDWIKVTPETMPGYGIKVQTYEDGVITNGRYFGETSELVDERGDSIKPSHWQPLPSNPKE